MPGGILVAGIDHYRGEQRQPRLARSSLNVHMATLSESEWMPEGCLTQVLSM